MTLILFGYDQQHTKLVSYYCSVYSCSFRYRHLGQFAPLGGEQTAAQLPGDWVSIGQSSQWLWYSVYAR